MPKSSELSVNFRASCIILVGGQQFACNIKAEKSLETPSRPSKTSNNDQGNNRVEICVLHHRHIAYRRLTRHAKRAQRIRQRKKNSRSDGIGVKNIVQVKQI